jgi:hypothetical protein
MAVVQQLDRALRTAIANKRLLRFEYKGSERIAEPHDYGIQNGKVRLLCWQVGGKSKGPLPGWRLVDVDGIHGCEMLDRTFSGNREVSDMHHRWDKIFIRVAPPEGSKVKKVG